MIGGVLMVGMGLMLARESGLDALAWYGAQYPFEIVLTTIFTGDTACQTPAVGSWHLAVLRRLRPPRGAAGGPRRLGTPQGRRRATGGPATASGARASHMGGSKVPQPLTPQDSSESGPRAARYVWAGGRGGSGSRPSSSLGSTAPSVTTSAAAGKMTDGG